MKPSPIWPSVGGFYAEVDCTFCALLDDRDGAVWVARRPGAAALLPRAPGRLHDAHVLVVSEDHVVGIQDASPQTLQAVMLLAQELARAMRASLGADGVNILNASGRGSQQSVPHLHFHVVPRWDDDGLDAWPSTASQHVLEDRWLDALRTTLDS